LNDGVEKHREGARSQAVSCRHIRTTLSAMLLHAALPTAFGGAADGARRRCRRRCDGGAAAELCTAPVAKCTGLLLVMATEVLASSLPAAAVIQLFYSLFSVLIFGRENRVKGGGWKLASCGDLYSF